MSELDVRIGQSIEHVAKVIRVKHFGGEREGSRISLSGPSYKELARLVKADPVSEG